ncbi:hypothetical protein DFH06DRAFT_1319693 [Mycena polygramma]|nr:hypothetical protein DFH06DRAFT_1319693 [Mycena polygramma]
MLFCPSCANLLVINDSSGVNKWACQTCPYQFPITKQHTFRIHLKTKRIGGIRDCQKCGHGFAYFNQLQIRSADEPMTIFYKYGSWQSAQ